MNKASSDVKISVQVSPCQLKFVHEFFYSLLIKTLLEHVNIQFKFSSQAERE